jgi:superfamily II DNA helicase RecQ
VEDVRAYVNRLGRGAQKGVAEIAPRELDDSERVLLSIAERAGAAELQPGARGVLRVRLTGRLDGRAAYGAIKAAKDRGWESYRAIERFIANAEECRRKQILEHFGDSQEGAREGRCCSVCDPDPELERALASGANGAKRARAAGAGSTLNCSPEPPALPLQPPDPVDEALYEKLREWRLGEAEGRPAFTVAANAVLEEILRRRPASLEEMVEIRGIGPAFCVKHGESLLAALAGL